MKVQQGKIPGKKQTGFCLLMCFLMVLLSSLCLCASVV